MTEPQPYAELRERLLAELVETGALALCEARAEDPEGVQVRFVDGDAHSATFIEIARHGARAIFEATAPTLLDRLIVLEGENERLRAAAQDCLGWGVHDEGCATDPVYGSGDKCDCGLDEAENNLRTTLSRKEGGSNAS